MDGDNRRPGVAPDGFPVLFAAGVMAVAALLVFGNGLQGPFVFDDGYITTDNPTIRQLWPLWAPLSPSPDSNTGGRPILNLSFALNYAVSGYEVWSYHALNLLIHLSAGLTLFGIVRRTLLLPGLRERFGKDALALASAVALLWMVHPVQTEAVTYIAQRAESMMGLFYLLTLYGFIRATETPGRWFWPVLSVAACALGMATKEVMMTAPLMVLLYDRTFVSGSFREAWGQRWRLYSWLAATWLLLGWLLRDIATRHVGLGFGVSSRTYAWTECGAVAHYIALAAWPHPLVIDYGTRLADGPWSVLPQALLVAVLLTATAVAFLRWPRLGFGGVWFFLILAPTSSVIPVPLSPVGDHRLYLPLAGLVLWVVLGLHALLGKRFLWAVGALALVWSALTFLRNEDFSSALRLWRQTVTACPDNARAHNDYGEFLVLNRQPAEAIGQFREALLLDPDYTEAQNNWGYSLFLMRQTPEAITHYEEALKIDPGNAAAHYNWGNALASAGQWAQAMEHYRTAIRLKSNFMEAYRNLGIVLMKTGRADEAIGQFQEALRLDPDDEASRSNLALLTRAEGK